VCGHRGPQGGLAAEGTHVRFRRDVRAFTPVFAGYGPRNPPTLAEPERWATRRSALGIRVNVRGGATPPYRQAQTKKPGAVSRPGTIREFQFHE
jgi:hypothetical protein